jgi:antitoxin ParD1/3/4
MARNASLALDLDMTALIDRQLASGRFGDAEDVVRAGLRLLDAEDARLAELRAALAEGEASGPSTPFDFEAFLTTKRSRPESL